MGFFRRDKDEPPEPARPSIGQQEGQPLVELSHEERTIVVNELEELVIEGMGGAQLERDTLELLQLGLPYLLQRECSDESIIAGQTAARLGYLSRAAEFAMFDGGLETDPDLFETLRSRLEAAESDDTSDADVMADLAAEMAVGESLNPPRHEPAPSWTLPGLGADVRGNLRDNLLSRMQAPSDVMPDDLRRTWKYGYFLCALDELFEDED